MTVTQKHSAPLHPRFPTCNENRFCITSFLSSELWGFKTSGCINVSLTRFQTTFSSDERKRLFPCIPGCMWPALIFSLTVSVRVKPGTQLLVESVILLLESFQVCVYFLSIFANFFVYHFKITERNCFNSRKNNLGTVLHDIHGNCVWVLEVRLEIFSGNRKWRSIWQRGSQSEGTIWVPSVDLGISKGIYSANISKAVYRACAMFVRWSSYVLFYTFV